MASLSPNRYLHLHLHPPLSTSDLRLHCHPPTQGLAPDAVQSTTVCKVLRRSGRVQEALSVAAELQTCSNSENDLIAQNQMVHLLCLSGRIVEAERAADSAAAYAALVRGMGLRREGHQQVVRATAGWVVCCEPAGRLRRWSRQPTALRLALHWSREGEAVVMYKGKGRAWMG